MRPNMKKDGSIVATVSPERVLSVDMRLERRAARDAGKTEMATTMLRRKDVVLYVVSLLCLLACVHRRVMLIAVSNLAIMRQLLH